MDGLDVSKFITDGPTALLVILLLSALLGAYRGWWVPAYLYNQLREDVDTQSDVNEKMVEVLTELSHDIRERRNRANGGGHSEW